MAKILTLDAYIALKSDHSNVESLGKWTFGVCVDTGISQSSYVQFPNDYNYFVGKVDDIYAFGGAIQIGKPGQSDNADIVKQFVPLVVGKDVGAYYNQSQYELKLVNSAGDFAAVGLTSGTSAQQYTLYHSDGTLIANGVPISGNTYGTNENRGLVTWAGFVVSNFADDGTFAPSATYHSLSVMATSTGRYYSLSSYSPSQAVIDFYNNITDYDPPSTDPYEAGGESDTGGGSGTFDGTGDNVDIPALPSLSATDTGFITLFNPSAAELKNLANYMWSNGFDLETFKKLFADPMDCILGLSIVPVAVPNGGSSPVSVGNISTGVIMTKAGSQYVEVDCGTLNVNEFWGGYLDYSPYTKAEIYLPYIGTHPLAVDDIMGKAVRVVYHVDILSGACIAFIKCGGSVLYSFIGQCSSSIPVTGNDWTNVINGVLSVAGAIGTMVATGGASAPMAAGVIASTAVNAMKPSVEKSGSLSGTGGMLGIQTPYLILTRPRQALPRKQNEFMGYPSFITENLDSLSGYTEIEYIHLNGVPATEQELSEIESLLKGGVIL